MKVRLIIAARATAGAMLLAVTLAACTGGSSTAPSIFTPTPSVSPSGTSSAVKTPSVGQSPATAKDSPTSKASGRATASDKPTSKPTAKPTAKATSTPRASTTPRAKPTPKATPRRAASTAPTPVPSATRFPNGAPQTGGGGTAGLQDGLLFGVGGAVIVAGLGSLSYRRRLRRKLRAGTPDRISETPTHTGVR
jgi:hypothetical protein